MPIIRPSRTWRRPRVVATTAGLRWESGQALGPSWSADRVALVVHWSAVPEVSLSACTLVEHLREGGYEVVFISAAETPGVLRWRSGLRQPTATYRRANVGYDFGSWAAGLAALPGIARAKHALLVNDSMLGPFAPLETVLDHFEASSADVWGLVSSGQEGRHLQSHFIGYHHGCLAREPLAGFWRSIRIERDKRDIIKNYELGLGRLIYTSGLSVDACYPWDLVVSEGDNPTIQGWRRLLLHGFPFVKREVVLRPHEVLMDADHVGPVVSARFGQDIREWL